MFLPLWYSIYGWNGSQEVDSRIFTIIISGQMKNPHEGVASHHQQRFFINNWAGICSDNLYGPQLLRNILTGPNHKTFFANNVPLTNHWELHIMHDGAPAHLSPVACRYLKRKFPSHWIGWGGPAVWPPLSPDWNPMAFYLWGNLISLFYSSPADDVEKSLKSDCGRFSYNARNLGLSSGGNETPSWRLYSGGGGPKFI
jgi:hypothetical protein